MLYRTPKKIRLLLLLLLWLPLIATQAQAKDIYTSREAFLNERFSGAPPEPSVLWITKAIQAEIKPILHRPLRRLRLRYWIKDGSSVWILEEIGKEKPITAGFHVRQQRIEKVEILAFRESRGWEIRLPFFTRQYRRAGLTQNNRLDQNIDGITGATLSVRAINKLARVALVLHRHATK